MAATQPKRRSPAAPRKRSDGPAASRSEGNGKRRQLVDAEIYTVATKLFSEKGYASTSLQDIADAMGLSRPALYHYVDSKEDILARLVEEFTESKVHEHAAILSDATLDPLEKLRQVVTSTVSTVAEHPDRFRLLDRCESDLPEDMLKKHRKAKRAVRDAFVAVIEEGIAGGCFRPVDPTRSAFALIGMCTWVAWWFVPSSAADTEHTIQTIVDMATAAVGAGEGANAGGGTSTAMIHSIRRQLDILERVVASAASPPEPSGRT